MIQETIVTTQSKSGQVHIAPMGIHVTRAADPTASGFKLDPQFIILPFKPSTTLDNLLETKLAVINYCDDVRIFAGCLSGHSDWPLKPAEIINGHVLTMALAHTEVELVRIEDDPSRPKLICKVLHTVNHSPFLGFNRAQFAVLEAAILVSRLDRLPLEKIHQELDYLRIGLEKTAGEQEWEAWGWLLARIDQHRAGVKL
ncbi:MAG: DUF447 domain-containing protein [Methylococcaceae bacterium]|jgi:hypothetical protein